MRQLFGLLFAVVIFGVGVYLKRDSWFSDAAFASALAYAFFGGALIAFSDRVRSLKVFGGSLDFAEERINKATDKAVARIATEVGKHADRISALTDVARKQAERIEHFASGEPILTAIDGYFRTVMVYTDECGRKYADYTDKEGKCKRMYLK
jgi:hypothetical protein